MKPLLTILGIVICGNCFGQSDTAVIRMAFNYLNSDECKLACKDTVASWPDYNVEDANASRKKRKQKVPPIKYAPFFTNNKYCFVPYKYYKKLDTARAMNRITLEMNYLPPKECESKLIAMPVFLEKNIVRITFFDPPDMIDAPVKFGHAYEFELSLGDNKTIRLKKYDEAICN